MCGIVGWASSSSQKSPDIPLEKMRDQLLHRGPDDKGLWFSADGRVGMGHTRLSIVDLSSNAHQPMVLGHGAFAIVFNGEIHNFEEIRLDLEKAGYRFDSRSDTEVILHAYQQWGTSCVSRFDGMFAFALYDGTKQAVFLARDRVGEKPLFYTQHGGHLIWASEIKALLAYPEVRRRINHQALLDYLSYGFVGGADCIFEGIQKLLPAHGLLYNLRDGSNNLFRYWDVLDTSSGLKDAQHSAEQLVGELQELVFASVKRRLIADVPTGVLLSSGIDSTIIARAAAEFSSEALATFTVVNPSSPELDEGPGARAVANALGARHTELHIDSVDDSLLNSLARQYDEPIADHSLIPTYLVCRALHRKVKVALGGDGGDELFGGYPHYRLIQRQALLRKILPEVTRRSISLLAERALPVGYRGRNHLMGLSGDIGNAIAHVNLYFDEYSQTQLLSNHWSGPHDPRLARNRHDQFKGRDISPALRAMQTDFVTVLPDNYLVKTDRASMLAAVELRSPFLEPQIINFAFNRVPQALRFNRAEQKILLRLLGSKLLPEWNPSRKKSGFVLPLSQWMSGSIGRRFRDILSDPGQTLFNKRYIDKLFSLNRYGANNANRIFCLVMFELWRRHYNPTYRNPFAR